MGAVAGCLSTLTTQLSLSLLHLSGGILTLTAWNLSYFTGNGGVSPAAQWVTCPVLLSGDIGELAELLDSVADSTHRHLFRQGFWFPVHVLGTGR